MNANIESNIPIPERKSGSDGILSLMRQMKVGDSVVIPTLKVPGARSAARVIGKRICGRKLSDTETRIWVVEASE